VLNFLRNMLNIWAFGNSSIGQISTVIIPNFISVSFLDVLLVAHFIRNKDKMLDQSSDLKEDSLHISLHSCI